MKDEPGPDIAILGSGLDDRHLDFRLSVLVRRQAGVAWAVSLSLSGGPPPAAAHVVTTKDGKSYEGRVLADDAEQVVIETTFDGTKELRKADVAKVDTAVPPLREQLAFRLGQAKDVPGLVDLATWAKAKGFKPEVELVWRKVLELDPQNGKARKALGHVRVGAAWLTPEEKAVADKAAADAAQRAKGLVEHQGRWVTPQEKEALEFYEMAIQLDPQLAEAYAGRGKVMLRQNKLADAGKDFEKAIELKLEPEDSEVITGLALARVVDGKLDEGIKLVEDNRGKHKALKEGLFTYNAACVYSRACEYLDGHKDVPDREKKREDYRKKSLADLALSIKEGFDDFDWMAKDPDFAALREDAEFKKILASQPAKKPDSEKPDGDMPKDDE